LLLIAGVRTNNAYNGCERCIDVGKYAFGCVRFVEFDAPDRVDADWANYWKVFDRENQVWIEPLRQSERRELRNGYFLKENPRSILEEEPMVIHSMVS
jgi:hypothetical protein